MQTIRAAALCGLLAAATQVLGAQTPLAESITPRFEIARYAVDGNTLLRPEDIERTVAPFVGREKDFGDVQRALELLEQAYRDRGYGVVQVLLPEQDITRGVIRLHVREPRIGRIIIEGNRYFDAANVSASLPALHPGSTPNSQDVARNLQLLSEHPAKQTTVLFKSGAVADELDATVKVSDERPLKFSATIDNTGTGDSGRMRAGFGMLHSNLFNRDHVLNLQYLTSPANPDKAAIYGAGYRMPFYAYSSTLDLVAGYADANTGRLPGLFDVTGRATIYGARYTLHLPKRGEYEHRVSFGLDYRAYKSQVPPPGAAGIPAVTVHPASLGYAALWRGTNARFELHVEYLQNVFSGGRHGADGDFKAARSGASADYRIWRAGTNYTHMIARGWQLRAVAQGQYSSDALVSGEQSAFGGPDSVRGFNLREVTGDRGYAGSLEIYTPELEAQVIGKGTHPRLMAFYDVGSVGRNNALAGELSTQSGSSAGIGLRLMRGKRLNLRLDAAQVINSAGQQARGERRLHASAVISF